MAFPLEELLCGWRNALITSAAITRSLGKLAEKIGDDSVLSPQVFVASISWLISPPHTHTYTRAICIIQIRCGERCWERGLSVIGRKCRKLVPVVWLAAAPGGALPA